MATPKKRDPKGGTSTSNFGVGKRENHDASAFYERFEAPSLSGDDDVPAPYEIENPFVEGDARQMREVRDNSVALVVTSPPYFAGKQYEEELEREGVPASYLEYLDMLRAVFAECARKLEPGGRIAVNVANLGRKPYRSLSADVIHILQDDLKLLLRGEVIWRKGEGAAGNCAWGSFRNAANPVVRDITERVVIASKGRFDRAKGRPERERSGLPSESTIDADEFMAATLDVWDIPPESARRVSHPAPFPVELPERLIRLYTYTGDLVLDPFMGSGSTLVAAARLARRIVGYDLDPTYVDIARLRVRDEGAPNEGPAIERVSSTPPEAAGDSADFQARASREGKAAQALAEELLKETGFTIVAKNQRVRGTGVVINFIATDAAEVEWYFDVSGAFTSTRGGLLRTDTVWKSLGRAHVLARAGKGPIVFLTSHLPRRGSEGDVALRSADDIVFDVIEMRTSKGYESLRKYAAGGHT
ncbi:MAG: modification methylase [Actinomycetota bacterium]|jgi:site-specific DNA-methyltransferase (adenine-specific)|nr:modification methylase [Actinomycetota bacterium]